MEGRERLHRKGIFPAGQQRHRLQTIVVKVVVTDIDGVGLHPQRRIARHNPIGIDDQSVARRLQPKAAVAQHVMYISASCHEFLEYRNKSDQNVIAAEYVPMIAE